jgi:hypothetical protein
MMASVWSYALAALLATTGPAGAAWNNVFQVCCNNCGSTSMASPVVSAGNGCCPQPCPQQVCTTRYVQRSYYQPVTTYKQVSYYEAVTTYRTSYYYEPVTTYRYSCYYDPCTCRYQQVATPCTSYRLRSQCCPVTSYLQRCALQPVTSYQQVCYYEPVTTCCTTTVGAPVMGMAPGTTTQPPSVTEGQQQPMTNPPGVTESQMPNTSRLQPMPRVEGGSLRQPETKAPATAPNVRLDRIVSLPSHNLSGQVVSQGRPQAGARVLLVSADRSRTQQTVTADSRGEFQVKLASGSWLVYVHGADGKPIFQDKVDVRDGASRQVVLTSR